MYTLKKGIRSGAKLVPPIGRLLAQRDALVQEVQSLRSLLQASQAPGARGAKGTEAGGGDAGGVNLDPLAFSPLWMVQATPGLTAGETCDDAIMVERVLRAYKASLSTAALVKPSANWETIYHERQLPIHKVIVGGDVAAATALLRRPGDSNLFWGFDGLVGEYVKSYKSSAESALYSAKLSQDHLTRAAEDIGALRYGNPEMPGSMRTRSTEEVVAALEKELGCEIRFPNPYPDEVGVQTSRGIASYRAVHALFQAWRIRQLVHGIDKPRVLELGGGLGRTAYYAHMLGVTDYTIIDLPFTGLSQGYFLMRTLGEDQVALEGEQQNDVAGKVKILNPTSFLESSRQYDLIVNVDSLTEMGRATAERYWTRIQAATPVFLSINHEGNAFTVKDLIDRSSERIAKSLRHPYGIRRGYAEEIVHFRT